MAAVHAPCQGYRLWLMTRLLDLQKRIEDLEGPKVMELASVSTSHPIYSWGHPGSGVGWRWGCT